MSYKDNGACLDAAWMVFIWCLQVFVFFCMVFGWCFVKCLHGVWMVFGYGVWMVFGWCLQVFFFFFYGVWMVFCKVFGCLGGVCKVFGCLHGV